MRFLQLVDISWILYFSKLSILLWIWTVFFGFRTWRARRRTPKLVTRRRKGVHAVEHAMCSQPVHRVCLLSRWITFVHRRRMVQSSDQLLLQQGCVQHAFAALTQPQEGPNSCREFHHTFRAVLLIHSLQHKRAEATRVLRNPIRAKPLGTRSGRSLVCRS